MAQYAILIYEAAARGTADEHEEHADDLLRSGAMVAAFGLQPSAMATTVSRDTITDGPFVDAKEVVAGFCIIEAPDLDAALKIARENPAARHGGSVEVRPVRGGVVVPPSA
ncbi:YciI family protein [Antribacter gilvus]|uniref:YciI family protein n=1 Tax=Antribacter gilvus TaxID=2304675 RepID=UPI000F769376|nr:YciI family protein [Antribacter gilvus]